MNIAIGSYTYITSESIYIVYSSVFIEICK